MKFLPFLVAREGHACSVGPPHLENPSQTLLEVELALAVLLVGVSWTLLWCADYKCMGKMDIKLKEFRYQARELSILFTKATQGIWQDLA